MDTNLCCVLHSESCLYSVASVHPKLSTRNLCILAIATRFNKPLLKRPAGKNTMRSVRARVSQATEKLPFLACVWKARHVAQTFENEGQCVRVLEFLGQRNASVLAISRIRVVR